MQMNISKFAARSESWLPRLLISPAFVVSVLFFYGLTAWVVMVSFTGSERQSEMFWGGVQHEFQLFEEFK